MTSVPWSLALQHMGELHAYEHLLVYLLAFGPFLLLALTIWISRRRNAREHEQSEESDDDNTDLTTSEHPPSRH